MFVYLSKYNVIILSKRRQDSPCEDIHACDCLPRIQGTFDLLLFNNLEIVITIMSNNWCPQLVEGSTLRLCISDTIIKTEWLPEKQLFPCKFWHIHSFTKWQLFFSQIGFQANSSRIPNSREDQADGQWWVNYLKLDRWLAARGRRCNGRGNVTLLIQVKAFKS